MLTIVGGAYREICLHPQWNALYGSAVRAAAAVASLGSTRGVRLHSWISDSCEGDLKGTAASYGFDVETRRRHFEIEFQYDHPMSLPRLYPDERDIQPIQCETIEAENVVCFSLIEGEFRIKAKRLVFDPQAGWRSKTPSASGHSAQTIGIVANLSEVMAMLGPTTIMPQTSDHIPSLFGKALLHREKCSVVVVKNGTEGATVVTESQTKVVPCFRTDQVFPIGSGDVFSSVFGFYWLEEGRDPFVAAHLASAGTAQYCGSRVLPIPSNLPEIARTIQVAPAMTGVRRVYLAGPLFTLPQLWLLSEAKRALEGQNLVVFSPKDEVGFLADVSNARRVAQADLRGLEESDLVFAILDGLDSGTVFEVGYARAKKKPVIGFFENVNPMALTMILGTDCRVFDDFSTAVYQTAWTARTL